MFDLVKEKVQICSTFGKLYCFTHFSRVKKLTNASRQTFLCTESGLRSCQKGTLGTLSVCGVKPGPIGGGGPSLGLLMHLVSALFILHI